MKEYSIFPKAPDLKPQHKMQFSVIHRKHVVRMSSQSAEMQSTYFAAPDKKKGGCLNMFHGFKNKKILFLFIVKELNIKIFKKLIQMIVVILQVST